MNANDAALAFIRAEVAKVTDVPYHALMRAAEYCATTCVPLQPEHRTALLAVVQLRTGVDLSDSSDNKVSRAFLAAAGFQGIASRSAPTKRTRRP